MTGTSYAYVARINTSELEPADLRLLLKPAAIFIATATLATVAVQAPTGVPRLSVLASLPLLFVLPGYAVVTALCLHEQPLTDGGQGRATRVIERGSLSVVGSILVAACTGFSLVLSPFALSRGNIVFLLTAITTVAVLVIVRAQLQKLGTPAKRQSSYVIDLFSGWQRQPHLTKVVTVLLVTSLVCAMGATSYALTTEIRGEQYTEFYLLTENESGQLVAEDYPTELTAGEPRSLTVGVTNREPSTAQYSVVVELQRLQRDTTETQVLERAELTRYRTRLGPTETSNRTVQLEPSMTGENLRLTFLLYTDEPPADPTSESAYRDIHLWVTVTPPE